MTANLLVIDDEPNVLFSLREALAAPDLEVRTAPTARAGLDAVRASRPDAVVLDVRLPDMSGLEAFDRIREIAPGLPVIVITAFAATETAIEATKRGAAEYLLKPVDLRQLRAAVARAVETGRLRAGPAAAGPEGDGPADLIVGRSAAMQGVYKAIGRLAPQDVTVLVRGESGTGKELVARALHQHSRRADKAFVAINCAAIPEALLESELFGHERGAFTGADRQRAGKFEQADGGTLFLDEIGDMSPATQAKVLRLLQEQRFERLGGGRTIEADVRLVAATNRDLDGMVAAGAFRQDLLYRLNGFTIPLPPLRDREGDVAVLVEHFLRLSARKTGRGVRSVADAALAALEAHPWPGNVRELQSAVHFAVIQAVGDVVTADCLPAHLRPASADAPAEDRPGALIDVAGLTRRLLAGGGEDVYRQVVQEVDRAVLDVVLGHVQGNQVHASDRLGISRTTLRNKMQALGLLTERGAPETEQC